MNNVPHLTLYIYLLHFIIYGLQICANLDSVIVSSKVYAPELKKKVPRPRKRFDIVDRRPQVS
jgi:hypothetical protein